MPEAQLAPPLPEVRKITFMGNTHFSSRTLQRQMATQDRPLWPPWKSGELYNRPTVEADLRRLKKFYFDRGFLDTTVRLTDVQQDPEADTVRLTMAIDEGLPTRVEEVRLTGTIPPELPAARELRDALPLQVGHRINKADFDQSRTLLLTRMQNAGYARAQVVPQTEVDPQQHTARVTFDLRPGARTHFGKIAITGAYQVRETAIRRALTIRQGERYNVEALSESADAIYDLGMFRTVTPLALNLEEEGAPLNVEFAVQERKPRTLQASFGLSTVERFFLSAAWIHRNVFGGAQQLRLSAHAGSFEQRFHANLYLPYALWPRTSFAQTFFVRNEQAINTDPTGLFDQVFTVEDPQSNYDLLSVGGETRLGYQFSRVLSGAAGLEMSLNDFRDVDVAALVLVGEELPEDNQLLIQFAELFWNTSDDLLNPTRGWQLRGRVEHASTAVLSDASFVKLLVEGRHYQPLWRRVILATRLEVGGIQPYGRSEDVPFNVRFFAGGPGSVRGFALDRLGPLSASGGPIGGQSLIEGSVEIRFPIAGALGGAVFVDFGNVFRDAFDYRLGDLRYTTGPGLRYDTPIGPVRLDVAFILDRREGEDLARLELSIGQPF